MAETLQSVSQALRILELLQVHETLGVSEIAEKLSVGSSTAHRLLATLAEANFVRQGPQGRKYQLGSAMQGSGTGAAIEHCVEIGLPYMERLRDATGETIHIAILSRTSTRFVAAVESNHMMRVTSRVGRILPAHTTAAGKLLLSYLPDDELAALYPDGTLLSGTPESFHSLSDLRGELESARADGYARNLAESEQGVAALAVPVYRPAGPVLCSLTVTGPDSRFNPERSRDLSARERSLLAMLFECAERISAELSF